MSHYPGASGPSAEPKEAGLVCSVEGREPAAMSAMLSKEEYSRRLAKTLQTELGQLLANAVIELEYSASLLDTDPHAVREGLHHLKEELKRGLERLHWLIGDLEAPPLLNELGLGPSLKRYAERFAAYAGLTVDITGLEEFRRRLPASVELAVFRVIQEALRNVHAHAGATRVEIHAEVAPPMCIFSVRDNGRGFSLPQAAGGLGLLDMRERVQAVGGTLRVLSRDGCGTEVIVSVLDPSL